MFAWLVAEQANESNLEVVQRLDIEGVYLRLELVTFHHTLVAFVICILPGIFYLITLRFCLVDAI